MNFYRKSSSISETGLLGETDDGAGPLTEPPRILRLAGRLTYTTVEDIGEVVGAGSESGLQCKSETRRMNSPKSLPF